MSKLERKLDGLLAKEFGVPPGEVNDRVDSWHHDHPFPIESYELESINGGYITHRSHVPTEREIKEMRERANAFLDQYSKAAKS